MTSEMTDFHATRSAVVTGASSGIGHATALQLSDQGWKVFAGARRLDRLEELAAQVAQPTGEIIPLELDVTDQDSVDRFVVAVTEAGGVDTVINIAGGAHGTDPIGQSKDEDWDWMLQTNVMGALRVIRGFLPMLRESGAGTVLNLTSTAGIVAYEGGAGYNAAKFGEHALTAALRLEEAEHNLRVVEVLPGLVKTDEFALNRMGGDADAAAKVSEGVAEPLTAEDVAEVCVYAVTLPHHINLDQIVMRPVKQAAQHKLIRDA